MVGETKSHFLLRFEEIITLGMVRTNHLNGSERLLSFVFVLLTYLSCDTGISDGAESDRSHPSGGVSRNSTRFVRPYLL
jgi:hypothetical protein